jgi:hypothetical protein
MQNSKIISVHNYVAPTPARKNYAASASCPAPALQNLENWQAHISNKKESVFQ